MAFFDALRERIEALPGVRSSATVTVAPWNGYTAGGPDSIFASGIAAGIGDADLASSVAVTDDYFATMGIPIRGGREFTTADREGAPLVAVVSENVARRYWPGASPIGRQLRIGKRDAPLVEVVGVAGDVRAEPHRQLEPTIYIPIRQHPRGGTSFVVRTSGDAMLLVPAIRRALHDLDPGIPLVVAQTLKDRFADMLGAQTLTLVLVASFAALALLLAALGVYSVMAYSVGERHREFGIRAALGAQRKSVLALVLRQGLTMALVGTALGLLLALWATRLLTGLLAGVAPRDPLTFASIALILLSVCSLACYIPARRAMRADPVEALRAD
jgi:predicted permease